MNVCHVFKGFMHPRWCRISVINSVYIGAPVHKTTHHLVTPRCAVHFWWLVVSPGSCQKHGKLRWKSTKTVRGHNVTTNDIDNIIIFHQVARHFSMPSGPHEWGGDLQILQNHYRTSSDTFSAFKNTSVVSTLFGGKLYTTIFVCKKLGMLQHSLTIESDKAKESPTKKLISLDSLLQDGSEFYIMFPI